MYGLTRRSCNNNWVDHFQQEINRLFQFPMFETQDSFWIPAMDVTESKNQVVLKADLPGIDKDNVKVSVENGVLSVEGEKKQESEKTEGETLRKERFYGRFYRSIVLPNGVDTTNIKATFKNGVLELTLPKKEEAKPKQIKVDIE